MHSASAVASRRKPRRTHGSGYRFLLALALGVVALSVIGMHQLSLGHTFAAPPAGVQPAGTHHREASDHGRASASAGDQTLSETMITGAGDGCPGCVGHGMAFSACLLALTLLVLGWLLAPPRARHLPPRRLRRPATRPTSAGRRVPALSLAQLATLRT